MVVEWWTLGLSSRGGHRLVHTPLGWAQILARKPGAYGTNGPLTRTRDGSFITASSFRWTIREKLPTKPDEHYADSEPVKTARGQPRTSPQSTHAA